MKISVSLLQTYIVRRFIKMFNDIYMHVCTEHEELTLYLPPHAYSPVHLLHTFISSYVNVAVLL